MKEDFLHYIWRYKKLDFSKKIYSTDGNEIEIIRFGDYTQLSGPDFFNAHIKIDGQLWVGNVEMHLKSSDWYAHRHETDAAYNNVILHIVWEDDVPIFRSDNTPLTTLEIKNYISDDFLNNYQQLIKPKSFLYCEKNIRSMPSFEWQCWKERLLLERLEYKAQTIEKYLLHTISHWEEVLYILLLRNFGLNINGDYFERLALQIPYKVMQKERPEIEHIEALLLGFSNLLHQPQDGYSIRLNSHFKYLKNKYGLEQHIEEKPQFFKLRPDNFPTIRLAQFAMLMHRNEHLFSKLMHCGDYAGFQHILKSSTSDYWKNHYVISKESKERIKKTSVSFLDLLIINTILPLQFVYQKSRGNDNFEQIISVYQSIPVEQNSVVEQFLRSGINSESAFDSQSLIQLHKSYCTHQKCLHCAVGSWFLANN